METRRGEPVEVGVLGSSPRKPPKPAEEIGQNYQYVVLHSTLTKTEELPHFYFPYSTPSRAADHVYEFASTHVMELITHSRRFASKSPRSGMHSLGT